MGGYGSQHILPCHIGNPLRRRILPLLLLILVISSACALLDGPPQPIIPTPPPTIEARELGVAIPGETVFDPISDVLPTIDPLIQALVDNVSQQQLMGYVQTLQGFGTRNAFSKTDDPAVGIGAARQWLYDEFNRVGSGRLQVELDSFTMNYGGLETIQQNVVATLPGLAPTNDLIVVMAHYDTRREDDTDGTTRSPSADDNGSGVALLMESARLLSSQQWHQTVVFIAMAAEEQGSFGARHYVKQLVLAGANVLLAVNYDTVGGRLGIPQSVRLFAPELNRSPHGAIGRYYDFMGEFYLPTFAVNIIDAADREGRWGDQREFVQAGLPALRVTESVEDPDLLNSSLDVWDLIDYAYLQKVTRLNVAVIANAAGAPAIPPIPVVAPMADPGSFILTWTVDPAASGYIISLRPENSGDYAPFRFVSGGQAGNVVLTGYDPGATYQISLSALDDNGRVSLFSPEIRVSWSN